MRELRSQCQGRPLRTLYAFDPRRVAILLIGGDKTGDDRWYDIYVPLADTVYDRYLEELGSEKLEEEYMTHPFSRLRESMPLEDRLENERAAAQILAELAEQEQQSAAPLQSETASVKQPLKKTAQSYAAR